MADPDRRACGKCHRLFAARMAMCPFCGHREAAAAPQPAPSPGATPPAPSRAPAAVDFAAVAEELVPVLRLSGVVPNYTTASLAGLDAMLDGLWGDGKETPDAADAAPLVRQVACYVGEVIRRRWGGRWTADPRTPGQGRVVLAGGLAIDPFSYADLRCRIGRSHDLVSQLELTRGLIAARGGAPPAPADPAEAQHWNEQGDSFQLRGRPDLALRFYERVIELAPESGAGWYGTGTCHAFQGRFAEALPCFDRAVELAPDFPEAWENRAGVLIELGRLDEAGRSLDRVVALAPQKASGHANRGNLLRRLGRPAEALASYDEATRLDARYRPAWVEKAALLAELGRPADAVACHDTALELDAQDPAAWLARARCLVALERPEDALQSYAEAVRRDPRSAAGWYQKARLEAELGQKAEAVRSLEAFLALEVTDDPEAVADARQRLAALEGDPARFMAEAEALARAGRVEETVARYEKVVGLDPGRAVAWRERGVGLALLQRFDEALASFDRALALAPEDPTAWDHKAVTLARMDRSDEALVLLDRALALAPGRGVLLKHRGACLENLGRLDEAVTAYDQALAAEPPVPEAWLLKASAEERLGRRRDAADSLRRFVATAPPAMAAQVETARRQLAALERAPAPAEGGGLAGALDPDAVSHVPDAQAGYETALAHVRAERFAEALPGFERATRLDPENATLWKDRGLALSEVGRDAEAVPCFTRSIELGRLSAGPYYSRARAHERLGQRAEAGRDYQMFLVLDYPVDREWAAHARQRLQEWGLPELDLRELGLFDEFMAVHLELARQVGAREDDPALWVELGKNFVGADRVDVAFHCMEKATALDPTCVEAWFWSGTLCSDRDRFDEALRRFDRVVALAPRDADAWWYKVAMEERLGRPQAMRDSLRRYLAVAPPGDGRHRERIEKARALLATSGGA